MLIPPTGEELAFAAHVGEVLWRRRQALGPLTLQELASRVNLSRGSVTRIEQGQSLVGLLRLRRMASGLDIPLWTVIHTVEVGNEEEPVPPLPQTQPPGWMS